MKHMAHKFDVKNSGILDSPDRLQFLNPDSILGKIGLNRETIFVDLGCGTGYFAIPASLRVKKVYALDVQEEMLEILRGKIKNQNVGNIEIILSEESSIPLPDSSVDMLFMANVFHELENRVSILEEVKRVLSGGGKLIIVDWKKLEMDFGPPIEERFTAEDVISICKDAGFKLREQLDAGPYNYLLILETTGIPGKKPTFEEEIPADKYFHGERKKYKDIDDLIKKTILDRKKRRLQQLER